MLSYKENKDRLAMILLLSFFFITLGSFKCNPGGPIDSGTGGTGGQMETQVLCCREVPTGYILINDDWDPTKCGEPSSITYNVCTYQRFDNKAINSVMTVCSSALNPPGWSTVDTDWDPTKCGHPSSNTNNMKTIKRIN